MARRPSKNVSVDPTREAQILPFERPQPQLKLMPKGPEDKDWLSPMATGTEFLCKDKTGRTPRWLIIEYTHCGLIKGSVLLSPTISLNDPRSWFWVDPEAFCQEWELRGVLEIPGEPTNEKEN